MGGSRWDADDWSRHSAATSAKPAAQIFTQTGLAAALDPRGIKARESRNSPANPRSTPIILAVDETGSMGVLAETIIKTGLGVVMKEIYDHKPVTDPHILCAAVGDAESDRSPIQVTQFEASIVLAEQVEKFFIEHNGGGNGGESYPLVWWFAHNKTACDAFKEGRKGFIFTIGDECPHPVLQADQIERFFGVRSESVKASDLLAQIVPNWEVFHLVVETSSSVSQDALNVWRRLLGERAIPVSDHNKIAEIIVSTMRVVAGHSVDDVVGSWDGSTGLVVRNAISGLTPGKSAGDLVRL